MKINNLLALFLLLAIIILKPLQGLAEASPEEVIDTSGKKLRVDANYYITPAVPFTICGIVKCFTGGGLTLHSTNESCPLDVIVVKESQGLPLRFIPFNSKKGVIRVSTDMNIRFFDFDKRCPHYSRVWKFGKTLVTTGGVVGNPKLRTINNWFKIEKYDEAYKLVYCPRVCPNCHHLCKDIGIFVDGNRYMHLGLSDIPFKVKFQKA